MHNITEITKRDIFDILTMGITLYEPRVAYDYLGREFHTEISYDVKMPYWGRLDEIAFLKRLYRLNEMPSYDPRFKDAEGDIGQHTVNNDDWGTDWAFNDDRLGLLKGEDEYILNFICEMFHPAVRNEKLQWKEFYTKINELFKTDGYELYEKEHVSGRSIYGWRILQSNNKILSAQSENIKNTFDTDYVRTQVGLMTDLIHTAPHSAIGKAKEMLEICCKTILDEQCITYSTELDLIQLMRLACESVNLSPKKIPENVSGRDIAGRILGNLSNFAQGMAELRNLYGDGHGKNKNFKPLPPRYANLAVGASVAAVNFIWETYLEHKKHHQNPVS